MIQKKLWLTSWFGGKLTHLNHILPFIPSHKIYCDVFGGMMPILLNKPKCETEIYNDINNRLVNVWKQIQLDYQYLYCACQMNINSRTKFLECMEESDDPKSDAINFLYLCLNSFSGICTSYSGLGRSKSLIHLAERLHDLHKRIENVKIENQDFRQLLPRCDKPSAFWYVDPPYFKGGENYASISGGQKWDSLKDINDLIEILNNSKSKWMLSIDKDISANFSNPTFVYSYNIQSKVDKIRTSRNLRQEYLIMNYEQKPIRTKDINLQEILSNFEE